MLKIIGERGFIGSALTKYVDKHKLRRYGSTVLCTHNEAPYLVNTKRHIVLLSSTAVLNPTNDYGRHKVAMELMAGPNVAILRLSKVSGVDMSIRQHWRMQRALGEKVTAFTNRYLQPIDINEVCKCIMNIVISRDTGIHTYYGKHRMSYYEFACRYFYPEHIAAIKAGDNVPDYP